MADLVPLSDIAPAKVETLLDAAFGADRQRRTAYRLRAGTSALPRLSLGAVTDGRLVGSIQCWPVRFCGDDGRAVPLVLVGPVAVLPARQRDGLGRRLMTAGLAAAADAGLADALMLIGDPDYYARFFGFSAARTAHWRLPGPVERHRLLARGAGVPDGAGVIAPRLPAVAGSAV